MLYDKTFPGEIKGKVYSPQREPMTNHMTDQGKNTTKVHGKPMSFIGVTYGVWVRVYWQEQK